MSDLLDRAIRFSFRAEDRASGSLTFRGVLAALWATAMGLTAVLVVVLIAWAADARSGAGAGAVVRTALQVWLLAHHAALSVTGGEFALAPLGLTLVPVLLLARAARVVATEQGESGPGGAVRVTAAVATPYALLTAVVTAFAATAHVHPMPVQALVSGALLAVFSAGIGAVRATGTMGEIAAWPPAELTAAVAAGLGAVCVLAAGGAGLAGTATIVHAGESQHVMDALHPGVIGWLTLLLIEIALAPNAVVFGTAYVVGPGFAVGAGSSIGPFSTHVGALPALPLLAALPRDAASWPVVLVVLGVVVAAGATAGALLVRGLPEDTSWRDVSLWGLAAGVCAGVVVALLAVVAGGSAGPGAFATVGPSPWLTGLAAGGEVALVAGATAVVARWWRG